MKGKKNHCKHKTLAGRRSRRQPIIFAHDKWEIVKLVLGLRSIFTDQNIKQRGKHSHSQFLTDPRHKAKCRLFHKTTTQCHQSIPSGGVFPDRFSCISALFSLRSRLCLQRLSHVTDRGKKKNTLDPFYHFVCHWGEKWVEKLWKIQALLPENRRLTKFYGGSHEVLPH